MTEFNIAIANANSTIEAKEVAKFFSENLPEFVFNVQKSGPGRKSAFDIIGVIAVVSTIADIQSIALVIKAAYDRFITPNKQKNPNAGLYIGFKDHDGIGGAFMVDAPPKVEVIIENLKVTPSSITANKIRIKHI